MTKPFPFGFVPIAEQVISTRLIIRLEDTDVAPPDEVTVNGYIYTRADAPQPPIPGDTEK